MRQAFANPCPAGPGARFRRILRIEDDVTDEGDEPAEDGTRRLQEQERLTADVIRDDVVEIMASRRRPRGYGGLVPHLKCFLNLRSAWASLASNLCGLGRKAVAKHETSHVAGKGRGFMIREKSGDRRCVSRIHA